ncbi:MAG: hypothetical protein KDD56_01565 [Bdellovibrionales bacterium]|nr:hypothetical protein [Bdellovibrionales bacterium]
MRFQSLLFILNFPTKFFCNKFFHKTLTFRLFLIFSLFVFSLPANSFAELPTDIEIRFTGATFSFSEDFIDNSDFRNYNYQAGIDILWRGRYFGGKTLQLEQAIVLTAGGKANYKTASGNGSCTGNFSYNSSLPYFPKINEVLNGVVKMTIPLPHSARNVSSLASIMDESAAFPGQCRTAKASLMSGDSVQNFGEYFPDFAAPADETLLGQLDYRLRDAYVEFNENSTNFSSAYRYQYEGFFNTEETLVQHNTIVWFAKITVSAKHSKGLPDPVDPFTLFGYTPPAPGEPPANPPVENPIPVSSDIREWLQQYGKLGEEIMRDYRNSESRTLKEIGVLTLDVPAADLQPGPADGIIQTHIIIKPKKKAKGVKPKFSKKALENSVFFGERPNPQFVLNSNARKLLESSKKIKVFMTSRFTPDEGKKVTVKKKFVIK